MVAISWLKQVTLLPLLSTFLVGVMAISFDVQVGNKDRLFCVRLTAGSYASTACVESPVFGTCLPYKDIVNAGKICSPDGVFCWDMYKDSDVFLFYYANKEFRWTKWQCYVDTWYNGCDTGRNYCTPPTISGGVCKDVC
jgi:hypothetical protein